MNKQYSIGEIVRFAVEIEKEGVIFYQKLANKTNKEDLKKVYLKLRDDEVEHQESYEKLLAELGPDNNEYVYHLDNEYVAYLHTFIENTIFDNDRVERLADSFADDISAIDYAINKEKISIEYYRNMKELVPEKDAAIIDRIIEEELRHSESLSQFKQELGK